MKKLLLLISVILLLSSCSKNCWDVLEKNYSGYVRHDVKHAPKPAKR